MCQHLLDAGAEVPGARLLLGPGRGLGRGHEAAELLAEVVEALVVVRQAEVLPDSLRVEALPQVQLQPIRDEYRVTGSANHSSPGRPSPG